YKQRLFVALGAKSGPDVFYNWGGGVLESYVKAGAVEDLTTSIDSAWKNRFLDLMWRGVTFSGRLYGVPSTEVQPVVWFYNKAVFRRLNL
ncbi:extracellular solute-binding protein, partial [Acinetobacter baumannii]